jgi:hypothetical protein
MPVSLPAFAASIGTSLLCDCDAIGYTARRTPFQWAELQMARCLRSSQDRDPVNLILPWGNLKMSAELKTHPTDGRELLREMLLRLQDETCQRVRDLRKYQEQESESGPADEMDSARTTAEVETHAGLIARAEEKLKFLDDALTRLDAGKYGWATQALKWCSLFSSFTTSGRTTRS